MSIIFSKMCVGKRERERGGKRSSAARASSPSGCRSVTKSVWAVWVAASVAESIHTHVRVSLTSGATSGRRRGVRAREWVTRNTVVFDGRAHVGGGCRLLLRQWVGRCRRPLWSGGETGPETTRSAALLLFIPLAPRVCVSCSLQLPQSSARELAFCRKK